MFKCKYANFCDMMYNCISFEPFDLVTVKANPRSKGRLFTLVVVVIDIFSTYQRKT